MLKFAVVGIGHANLVRGVDCMIEAGFECLGYSAEHSDPYVLSRFVETHPDMKTISRDEIVANEAVSIVYIGGNPAYRAEIAVEMMRSGKHVISDKPGVISASQLDIIKKTAQETGRKYLVCFAERACVRACVLADKLIADGEIGTVVQTMGVGPHRLDASRRPDWFFKREGFGQIIVNIGSHQIDQFLHYTSSKTAEIVSSTLGKFNWPEYDQLSEYGEVLLRTPKAAGYLRVDWLSPDGLPTWGDNRVTIIGTQGYIEIRKYVDLVGREAGDHLFLINQKGTRYIDAKSEELTFFTRLYADIGRGTDTAITQQHVFEVLRIALDAQNNAGWIGQRPAGL